MTKHSDLAVLFADMDDPECRRVNSIVEDSGLVFAKVRTRGIREAQLCWHGSRYTGFASIRASLERIVREQRA